MLKEGVRSIGIDDGPFNRMGKGDVLVVGAIYRGGTWFDGLLTTKVRKDGWNATTRIIDMLTQSKFIPQLHYAFFDGIAFGGFNVIDLDQFYRETGLKTAVVVRKKPNLKAVRRALQHLTRPEERWQIILKAGRFHQIGSLHCQLKGLGPEEAHAILNLTCTRANIPEPIRAAHLIAGGLVSGQSGRRA